MTLTIAVAVSDDDIAACMAVRWRVFVEEQGVPAADELDGTDHGCTHVIVRHNSETIGAARFKTTGGVAKIGRVCVDPSRRSGGIGARIIQFCCTQSGAARAQLSAQTSAIPFYERLGFATKGAVYMDAGIPHQDMEKALV